MFLWLLKLAVQLSGHDACVRKVAVVGLVWHILVVDVHLHSLHLLVSLELVRLAGALGRDLLLIAAFTLFL